jgi:hypothetical protein
MHKMPKLIPISGEAKRLGVHAKRSAVGNGMAKSSLAGLPATFDATT